MFDLATKVSAKLPRSLKDRIPQGLKDTYYESKEKFTRKNATQGNVVADLVDSLKHVSTLEYVRKKAVGWDEFSEAPSQIGAIEINDSCNLNCVMCKTGDSTRDKALMDLGLFEDIIAKLHDSGVRTTNFHTVGDPTANKKLPRYLDVIRKYNFTLHHLSSNCQLLERHLDTIFEYRDVISQFRPSIDAASKESYENIRLTGTWEALHKNLAQFAERNAAIAKPIPVYIGNVIAKQNFHELAFIPSVFSYVAPEINHSFALAIGRGPSTEDFLAYSYFEEEYIMNAPCGHNWDNIVILNNGRLSTCNLDFNGDLAFGHINDGELSNVFNNDTIRATRRAQLAGDVENMPAQCQKCYIVDPRYSKIINSVIQNFYHNIKRHPVYLQNALNEIGPMLKEHRFDDVLSVTESM